MKFDTDDEALIDNMANVLAELAILAGMTPDTEKYEDSLLEAIDFTSRATADVIAKFHGVDPASIAEQVAHRIDMELSLKLLKVVEYKLREKMGE